MTVQDCRPAYNLGDPPAFVPNFIANGQCSAPIFDEKRARLFAGGTFFRSKFGGTTTNLIEVEVIAGSPIFTLNVYLDGVLQEIFSTNEEDVYDAVPPFDCLTANSAADLRLQVNGVSHLIEMPDEDFGGVVESIPAPLPIFTSGTDCMSAFGPTFLFGGEGPPTDTAGLNAIRTGPSRALTILSLTEVIENDVTDEGILVLPEPEDRLRQYNGFDWVQYAPNSDCVFVP